jgi:hypothetical protein
MSIYPNPGSGVYFMKLSAPAVNSYEIKVLNILGKIVQEYKGMIPGNEENIRIDLSQYPDGIYVIQVVVNNRTETVKIIKADN